MEEFLRNNNKTEKKENEIEKPKIKEGVDFVFEQNYKLYESFYENFNSHDYVLWGDLFYEYENENLIKNKKILLHRGEKWTDKNIEKENFEHSCLYFIPSQEGLFSEQNEKEYLTQDLKERLNNESIKHKEKYSNNYSLKELKEFYKIHDNIIVNDPDVSTYEFTINSPLLLGGNRESFMSKSGWNFENDKIKISDIRYIKKEEVEELKKLGYDSIFIRDRDWVIILDKENNTLKKVSPKTYQEVELEHEKRAKEKYSEYLDTVFPESKEKDIFFHGTASKEKIEDFNFEKSNFAKAVFFTKNYELAKSFAFDDVRSGSIQEQILNIKKPFDFSNNEHIQELRGIIEELVKEGYKSENTGLVFRNDLPTINIGEKEIQNPSINDFVDHYMWRLQNGSWRIIETAKIIDFISKKYDSIIVNEKGIQNVAVFSQDQIHILGSQKDVEKFKEFISLEVEHSKTNA